MRRWIIGAVAVLLALIPGSAVAQTNREEGGVVVRVNGDYELPAGQQLGVLVVVRGDVAVRGTVHDTLVVVDGDATVSGRVEGEITVVKGSLRLESTAVVDDVSLFRSDLERDPGATVTGDITRSQRYWFRPAWAIAFGLILLAGLGIALMAAAVTFAAVGGRQLAGAANAMTAKVGPSILFAAIAVIGLPLLGAILLVAIVGIPVGIGILLFLLPALWLLGLVVAATWLGLLVTSRRDNPPAHPYAAAALGMLIFLVIFLIPGLGAAAFVVLGAWGTGALLYTAWRAIRDGGAPPAPAPAAPVAQP